MKKKQTKPSSLNPFQDEATKNQSPHWSNDQAKPGVEEIPASLQPRPLVAPKLTDQPPTTEAAEGTSGMPEPEFEDEPAPQ